jgi:hypothetical protein
LGLIGLGAAGLYAHGLPLDAINRIAIVDRDCADFSTEAEAQAFFLAQGSGDWHQLDADSDGRACEALP